MLDAVYCGRATRLTRSVFTESVLRALCASSGYRTLLVVMILCCATFGFIVFLIYLVVSLTLLVLALVSGGLLDGFPGIGPVVGGSSVRELGGGADGPLSLSGAVFLDFAVGLLLLLCFLASRCETRTVVVEVPVGYGAC